MKVNANSYFDKMFFSSYSARVYHKYEIYLRWQGSRSSKFVWYESRFLKWYISKTSTFDSPDIFSDHHISHKIVNRSRLKFVFKRSRTRYNSSISGPNKYLIRNASLDVKKISPKKNIKTLMSDDNEILLLCWIKIKTPKLNGIRDNIVDSCSLDWFVVKYLSKNTSKAVIENIVIWCSMFRT